MSKAANQVIVSQQCGRLKLPVAATTHLYEGCLSFVDASGNAVATTNSGANKLAGMNVEEVDNSGGSAGDKLIELLREVVQLEGSGFTDADVGKLAYVSDNFTVTLTAAGNTFAGPIVKVISSTKVMVDLDDSFLDYAVLDADETLQTITFDGTTGVNEMRLPTNLADALSVEDSNGDLVKFVTTTGAQKIVVTPNLEITTKITAAGSTFVPFTPMGVHTTSVAAAGAVPITNFYSTLDSNAGATTATLANGAVIGQLKKIKMIVDGGDCVLTPANLANGTTITFADVGDTALLIWNGTDWVVIELSNDADGATAPVLA